MALSRKDCGQIRVAINRAAVGPPWMRDEGPIAPELRALRAELRARTQEWLRTEIIKHLQGMMPVDERVKLP